MRISFIPQRRDDVLTLEKSAGERLRINGELFNFDPLNDGDTIPAMTIPCDWILGPVEKVDGEVRITLSLPVGPDGLSAEPDPITVTEAGPITLPVTEEQANVDA